jgi:superfamily I DNA/RNA helicase
MIDLNEQQLAAVRAGDGPIAIIAGPGTGKTKTLTARIAHLVDSGRAAPDEILALTFTNKAAREMQERLRPLLSSPPLVCTFHGLAYRLLGEPAETLISDNTRNELLRDLSAQTKPKLAARDLGLLISSAKNQLQPSKDPAVHAAVAAYNDLLAQKQLYDFDDLLLRLHAWLHVPEHTVPYRYILVDEFQDTNDLQFELLKLLNVTGNLFVIGDPLQSIYGFRGAHAGIFDRFLQEWPSASKIVLETNYRSVPLIVATANAIFPDAPALTASRDEAGVVQCIEVLNEYSEADWVVNQIEQQLAGSTMLRSSEHHSTDKQRTFKDFAVLYRTHAAARAAQKALEANGIPYQIAGEGSPYEKPYIQTILDALSFVDGTGQAPAVGPHTSSQIAHLLAPLVQRQPMPLTQLVQEIINKLSLESDKYAVALRQFTNSLLPYDDRPLADYLEHIKIIADQAYYDPAADAVTLLTIHAAKGLEFSCVFLLAVEEGTLPHLPKNKPANLEEERRLFFVAVTRARDELYMLHARKRTSELRELSRFVTALPTVEHVLDPGLASQQRKIAKRQQKRSQTSMF